MKKDIDQMLNQWSIVIIFATIISRTLEFEEIDFPFLSIANETYYVDKTLPIEHFLQSNASLIVTAPTGFGKTTNLQMLHAYFQPPTTKYGLKISKKDSKRFKVFKEFKIGRQNPTFFESSFGSRPVIYYDFAGLNYFNNIEDTVSVLRLIFIDSILKYHGYLLLSADQNTTHFCTFCLNQTLKISKEDFLDCNLRLARILRDFYGVTPLVLIDEISAPFQFMLTKRTLLTEFKLREVATFLGYFIADMVERNPTLFWRGYLTGTTRLGLTFNYVNNLVFKSIFENLFDSYGFSESEFNHVVLRLKVNQLQKQQIYDYFYGYRAFDRKIKWKIFNPGVVMRYIKEGCPDLSKNSLSDYFKEQLRFFSSFSSHRLSVTLLEALKPKAVINLRETFNFGVEELLSLKNAEMFKNEVQYDRVKTLFLHYLLDNRLFTATKDKIKYRLTLPNKSAYAAIERLQKDFLDDYLGCTELDAEHLRKSVRQLDGSKKSLDYLTRSIARLFTRREFKEPENEFELAGPLYTYLTSKEDKVYGELFVPFSKPKKDGEGSHIDMLFRKSNGEVVFFETKHQKQRYAKYSSVQAIVYILEENYVRLIRQENIRNFILVGVFMNRTVCECSMLYRTLDIHESITSSVFLEDFREQKKKEKVKREGKKQETLVS